MIFKKIAKITIETSKSLEKFIRHAKTTVMIFKFKALIINHQKLKKPPNLDKSIRVAIETRSSDRFIHPLGDRTSINLHSNSSFDRKFSFFQENTPF